jgi:CBS-domain-containing membrane protein
MKVADVMSKRISTVLYTTSIRDLWKLLFKKHINAVPVVDSNQKLLGIITKDDLLHMLYPEYSEYIADFVTASDFEAMEDKIGEIAKKSARDIMSRRVIYTRDHTEMMRALSRMIARHVNQLPVLSDKDKVIGIV